MTGLIQNSRQEGNSSNLHLVGEVSELYVMLSMSRLITRCDRRSFVLD